MTTETPVYIQFIGSIPNSLEFCDVVTKDGFSIEAGQWESFPGNEKRLGPFYLKAITKPEDTE